MNTAFIAYGIDVVFDPALMALAGAGQDGAGQVSLQSGTQVFSDTQIVEIVVEQAEENGELTGATLIVGVNVYDSLADYEAGTILYSYQPEVAGTYAGVENTLTGMGDSYLSFDASMLVSTDPDAPALSTLFVAPGADANDQYGTLSLDRNSDFDFDGDGAIAPGSAEDGNGAYNTNYAAATYPEPSGTHVVEGSDGDDFIDTYYTGDPEGDRVDSNDAADGSNDDVIAAGAGNDTVLAGDGNDFIYGGSGDDQLEGGEGDDTFIGDEGHDIFYGGVGNDSAFGGVGNDSFEAYDGNDYFEGGAGDDWMNGDHGDDTLLGGAGNDWMRASFGNDVMAGGTGDDYVWSGYGDDTITLENDFGNDTIEMEDQEEVNGDILDMSAVTDDLDIDLRDINRGSGFISDGTSTASFAGVEHLVLGSGDDTIILGDLSGSDQVEGFAAPTLNADGSYSGHDRLDVSAMTDEDGNPVDVADVTVTDDGSGNAVLGFPGGEALTLIGVSPAELGSDAQLMAIGIPGDGSHTSEPDGTVEAPGAALNGIVEGGDGDDLIDAAFTGDPEGDMVDAGDAVDPAAGPDDDSIRAGAGNDTIDAGEGDDSLDGGDGDDLLIGGSGADTMLGGAGNDTFEVSSGDSAYGDEGDDQFYVDDALRDGQSFHLDGGSEIKGDTLYVNGPAKITFDESDPESGAVNWQDGSVLYFCDIEKVVHVPCFTRDSSIKVLGGEKRAADIRPGDMVLTRDDGYQPVVWAGTRVLTGPDLAANPSLRPVLIRKDALGAGVPERDLIVSPQHRMLISDPKTALWFGDEEVFVPAIHLTCLDGVEQLDGEPVTYIHFMFEKHQIVQGDGAWSESFQPGDLSLLSMDEAQRNEIVSLFPELYEASADEVYPAARPTLSGREARVLFA
ncbi:MAG: Hint domain-containing protein [Thalassovita sp.]|nr:Hint domain-containing protein [Thalassovita sp.]